MPALNISFTEDELARLRAQAQAQRTSMTKLAHNIVVDHTGRAEHNAVVMSASARVIGLSQDLLKRLADR
jgi:hypothetical protein